MRNNEKEVGLLLHRLGVSSKYYGFEFLSRAVVVLLNDKSYRWKSMKSIYAKLADEFSCSATCIERNIRTCIDRSWNKVSYETVSDIFGHTMDYENDSPTNRDFIFNLLDFFKFHK